jgi:hypothetical protein
MDNADIARNLFEDSQKRQVEPILLQTNPMPRLKLLVFLIFLVIGRPAHSEGFVIRGYYLTFMRMPVMGLPEWKRAIDCFAEDDANTLIVWTAGGFRSKKFPITWEYNREHENIRHDFLRDLIDYAHTKKIRVLLGFTPFGYDGVNRYPIEHPELKARKKDGLPVDEFGIHSWGWNLCPAQPESQRFMREYISEMLFDFYPNADGVLIESSDYAVCNCEQCGPHFYDNEFKFVRWISDELWKRNANATIVVFPHYFTGGKVPGFDITAARQPFDTRWSLAFSPHSAHFEPDLIARAAGSIYWSDAPALRTPVQVAEAARAARDHHVNGFIPSLEAFSYVAQHSEGGEQWLVGRRTQPFGFDALGEGHMPYTNLLVQVQRFATKTFSENSDLPFAEFKTQLSQHVFGTNSPAVTGLLELQRIWNFERDWYYSSPLLDPEFFEQRARRLQWSMAKLAEYDRNLSQLKQISIRYAGATDPAEKELSRLASMIIARWKDKTPASIKDWP